MGFTNRELVIMLVVCAYNITINLCSYIQAPFYPVEAKKKGATATEYGLVFGCFQFACFVISPYFGKIVHKTGPKTMFNYGIIIYAISCIAFGGLEYIWNTFLFISISLILRVIEAIGATAAMIGVSTLLMIIFPDKIGVAFGALETCFGVGMILGPFVGGILYSVGGFALPFVIVGIISIIVGIGVYFILPDVNEKKSIASVTGKVGVGKLLNMRPILIDAVGVVCVGIAYGYYNTLLETHLSDIGVGVIDTSYVFAITGIVYAISSLIIGKIVDKWAIHKEMNIFGCLMELISFSIVGPAPYIPIECNLFVVIIGMVLHGVGTSAIYITTFSGMLQNALSIDDANSFSTFGSVSSLWLSSYFLGSFVGPTFAGVLYDRVGFSDGSLFVIAVFVIFLLVVILFYHSGRYSRTNNNFIFSNTNKMIDYEDANRTLLNHNTKAYGSQVIIL